MSIQEKIDAMVAEAVTKAIEAALGEMSAPDTTTGRVNRQTTDDTTDDTPKRRRRSRPTGPRTTYVVALKRASKADLDRLFPTALQCWKAIARKSPMTAPEMEKATGLGKKTVESCIWFLRTNGYIKSKAL